MKIEECLDLTEINTTYTVMKQLRPTLDESMYGELIISMMKTDHYRLVALYDDKSVCCSVAGFRLKRSLFRDGQSELYIDDLVTDTESRSKGYGAFLMTWLKEEALRLKCVGISLDSGLQRKLAHQFYMDKMGMQSTALHFYSACPN